MSTNLPIEPDDRRLFDSLVAYADGELDDAERSAVEALLERSTLARELVGQHRLVAEAIRSLPRLEGLQPAESTLASVRQRLTHGGASEPATRLWRWSAAIAAAAALVLLVSLGFRALRTTTESGGAAGSGAVVTPASEVNRGTPSQEILEDLDVLEDLHAATSDLDAELVELLIDELAFQHDTENDGSDDDIPLDPELLDSWLPEELVGGNF